MAKKGKIEKFAFRETQERPERIKRYKYLFLIVCEDEKTEPLYFSKFKSRIPEDTLYLKTVGTGRDPKGVVNKAIEEKLLLENIVKKEIDTVWVVFDKDSADENLTKIKNFYDAFKNARENKFKIAYSNEVFELWLLLHLKEINSEKAIPRNEIYKLLESQIQKTHKYKSYTYDHKKPNPKTIDIIFELGDLKLAIQRAKVLDEKMKNIKPIDANPSTRVYLLIEELNEWIEFYSYKDK
ncbi:MULTISPECIES: RloB family protein [unclassified Arcicella]|uniref:RloB family protein n=1 Tax=unclassified Arcicella TaxID=2644986 RepID=UPI00286264AC|nr:MULTISPECIES: RloB family protein [unclassified Arcicella]MDR6563808.1 hypothetical protein [Arcicella sp. BE51]MDR6813508.1 hypothetical protein [Arcicella sp. BE140]MDR6824821.1 hypothetical protein [Arcicella sp. BE139]